MELNKNEFDPNGLLTRNKVRLKGILTFHICTLKIPHTNYCAQLLFFVHFILFNFKPTINIHLVFKEWNTLLVLYIISSALNGVHYHFLQPFLRTTGSIRVLFSFQWYYLRFFPQSYQTMFDRNDEYYELNSFILPIFLHRQKENVKNREYCICSLFLVGS